MRDFIKRIFLFIVPALVVTGLILYVQYSYRSKYSYKLTSNYKHKLIGSTESPKIVMVGDSNVGMGIDSEMLNEAFGLPVINMGVHNAYGLQYMLNEVDVYLKAGDIVVLLPEYGQYLGRFRGVGADLYELYTVSPGARQFFSSNHYFRMMRDFPKTFQWAALLCLKLIAGKAKKGDKFYTVDALNRFGDTIAHLDRPSPRDPTEYNIIIQYDGNMTPLDGAKYLVNRFARAWKQRKINVFLSFPPFPYVNYKDKNQDTIEKIETWMRESLEIKILGTNTDFLYPKDHFFDSAYHVNGKGREKRTRRLIHLLSKYLKYLDKN